MKSYLLAILVGITTILASPVSGQTPPPAEHPLFKAITGRWVGDGSLKTRDSGELEVHEEWVAAAEDGGGYRFAGTRKLGQETHEFSWLFLLNATSGAYECDYEQTGMDQPMRFEVSITETRVEVKSPLGGPGSELLITNSLDGNLLSGTVTHRDANGQEVSSGTVIHRRAE
jgi:hypothetical protein